MAYGQAYRKLQDVDVQSHVPRVALENDEALDPDDSGGSARVLIL